MPSHHQPLHDRYNSEPLCQQMLRSLAKDGRPLLRIVSNDSAADWLIRVGPLARRLNEESRHD